MRRRKAKGEEKGKNGYLPPFFVLSQPLILPIDIYLHLI